jgi:hypothetical protein
MRRTLVPPARLTADERLEEIAQILATGLMRLLERKSSPLSAASGDSSLDFNANRSGRATHETENKA